MESTAPAPTEIKATFAKFAKKPGQMTGKDFFKFAKDTKILKKNVVTSVDCDIIFSKVKTRGKRTITVKQFVSGCKELAKKRGEDYGEMMTRVVAAGGPKFKGTKADYVKFHDDKTTYTGVYAKGGPTTVDAGKGKVSDISQLCDRTKANVRGVKKSMI